MRPDLVRGNLDLLLLAIIADGSLHGYAVIEELRSRSGGALDLPEGTVYPALHRLERAGLLASAWDNSPGRRRRTCCRTPSGRKAATEKHQEFVRFSAVVHRIVGDGARTTAGGATWTPA